MPNPEFEGRSRTSRKARKEPARAGRIEEVLYPVFPSDADAGRVIEWLSSHSSGR
jgi:hypothetical protein